MSVLRIAVLAVIAASGVQAQGSCDRACLTGFIDRYLDALVKHDPKAAPLAANARFTENGATVAIGDGLWKTAVAVKARQYFLDPSTGNAACLAVVDEGSQLTIFGLRLKISWQSAASAVFC